jgi:uncharacterized protein (DUF58 family)
MNANGILHKLRNTFWRWIERRSPRSAGVTLRHRTIYILPTLHGLGFILVILLLWLLGTNYENNLILGLAFLLLALMVVSVVHTFRNLSGLELSAVRSRPAFAGDYVEFDVLVRAAPRSSHENIHMCWEAAMTVETDLIDQRERQITLSLKSARRGWLVPKRLRVSSEFPLGFMRAWSWVALDTRALVYPAPMVSEELPLQQLSHQEEGDTRSHENREDFQGFANYQAGAPLAQIAWKQYARGAGLHLKDYVGYQSSQVWLDWHSLQGDIEQRLSQLCYWVLQLSRTTTEYGLLLPGVTVPLGSSPEHQERVLRALALYGLAESREAN